MQSASSPGFSSKQDWVLRDKHDRCIPYSGSCRFPMSATDLDVGYLRPAEGGCTLRFMARCLRVAANKITCNWPISTRLLSTSTVSTTPLNGCFASPHILLPDGFCAKALRTQRRQRRQRPRSFTTFPMSPREC